MLQVPFCIMSVNILSASVNHIAEHKVNGCQGISASYKTEMLHGKEHTYKE